MISDSDYATLIDDLTRIEKDGCKCKADYNKRARFELKRVGDIKRLVKRGTGLVFLPITELFDQIHTAHVQLGKFCFFALI